MTQILCSQCGEKPSAYDSVFTLVGNWILCNRCLYDIVSNYFLKPQSLPTARSPKKVKIEKIQIREGVYLTEEEAKKSVDRFGEKLYYELVDELSIYVMSKGVKYKSHYHALMTFAKNRQARNPLGIGFTPKPSQNLVNQMVTKSVVQQFEEQEKTMEIEYGQVNDQSQDGADTRQDVLNLAQSVTKRLSR